jgi:tetratricopeptide (TPR) repeat protein
LNLSAAYLVQSEFPHARTYAGRALDIDPKNIKGLYRLGKALIGLEEKEDAKEILHLALKQLHLEEDEKTEEMENSIIKLLNSIK